MRHATGRPVHVSLASVLLLIAAAGGCTLLPAPRETANNTFVLLPEPAAPAATSGPCANRKSTLLVNVPREEPGFDTPRMAYLLQPNVVRYYADSRWIDTPARMMAPLLVQSMEETGCWRAVVRAPNAADADFRLDTEDLVLEQEFFHRPSRVRIAIRAILVDTRRHSVVGTRRFEALEEAPSEDAFGGATAANRAAGRILPAVASWAGEAVHAGDARPAPPAGP